MQHMFYLLYYVSIFCKLFSIHSKSFVKIIHRKFGYGQTYWPLQEQMTNNKCRYILRGIFYILTFPCDVVFFYFFLLLYSTEKQINVSTRFIGDSLSKTCQCLIIGIMSKCLIRNIMFKCNPDWFPPLNKKYRKGLFNYWNVYYRNTLVPITYKCSTRS